MCNYLYQNILKGARVLFILYSKFNTKDTIPEEGITNNHIIAVTFVCYLWCTKTIQPSLKNKALYEVLPM